MKRFLSIAMAMLIAVTVMAADKATAYFNVSPAMTCQNCENKIKSNLRYEKGVKSIATSIADQLVTVTYDPTKTTPANIVAAFKKIGYTATQATSTKQCAKEKASCSKKNGSCCKKNKDSKCCGKGECAKAKAKKACSGKSDCKNK